MIFNSKNEFGSQKQDTQTQTRRHTKTKETPVLVYLGMKFHCCCTLHLAAQSIWEKGGGKMRHLKTGPRNIGSSQTFRIGAVCWVGADHSSVHSIHPNCILQPVHTDTEKSCYHVVVIVLPLTSTTPDGYQCTFVTCVNSEAPISVSSLLQWWVCCTQARDQCNAMVKRNGGAAGLASRTCFETVGDCWATDCSFAQKLWA